MNRTYRVEEQQEPVEIPCMVGKCTYVAKDEADLVRHVMEDEHTDGQ